MAAPYPTSSGPPEYTEAQWREHQQMRAQHPQPQFAVQPTKPAHNPPCAGPCCQVHVQSYAPSHPVYVMDQNQQIYAQQAAYAQEQAYTQHEQENTQRRAYSQQEQEYMRQQAFARQNQTPPQIQQHPRVPPPQQHAQYPQHAYFQQQMYTQRPQYPAYPTDQMPSQRHMVPTQSPIAYPHPQPLRERPVNIPPSDPKPQKRKRADTAGRKTPPCQRDVARLRNAVDSMPIEFLRDFVMSTSMQHATAADTILQRYEAGLQHERTKIIDFSSTPNQVAGIVNDDYDHLRGSEQYEAAFEAFDNIQKIINNNVKDQVTTNSSFQTKSNALQALHQIGKILCEAAHDVVAREIQERFQSEDTLEAAMEHCLVACMSTDERLAMRDMDLGNKTFLDVMKVLLKESQGLHMFEGLQNVVEMLEGTNSFHEIADPSPNDDLKEIEERYTEEEIARAINGFPTKRPGMIEVEVASNGSGSRYGVPRDNGPLSAYDRQIV